jgi:hypothetical protein
MYLSTDAAAHWPDTIFILGILTLGTFLLAIAIASVHEFRKLKLVAKQEEALRQLVRRYEKLAESTLDAQQRVAADVSELRSRTTSIEQILRTVE